jgi:hypothetical protein
VFLNMFPIAPHFISYPLPLSSTVVTYISGPKGGDFDISILRLSKAWLNYWLSNQSCPSQKEKNWTWGSSQLINTSHTIVYWRLFHNIFIILAIIKYFFSMCQFFSKLVTYNIESSRNNVHTWSFHLFQDYMVMSWKVSKFQGIFILLLEWENET